MTRSQKPNGLPEPYIGRILREKFSDAVKSRVLEWIRTFHAFDRLGGPAIPYISAWEKDVHILWYEFVGRRFLDLLQCPPHLAAETFRNSIRERRVYHHDAAEGQIGEKIWTSGQIQGGWADMRHEVQQAGIVEAVYQSEPSPDQAFWLKDFATVLSFPDDGLAISLGNLTLVSKEMEQEEALKRTKESLRLSEQKYRYQAAHDNLTDLYNTRYLYTALTRLMEESTAEGRVFSLVFFDIDDFKKVVDLHGHLHASRVIQEVALTIRHVIAPPAFAVAYAGDEFVLVLPNQDREAAIETAHRTRERIRDTVYLKSQGLAVRIHASFGVAAFPDDAEDLSELLALADRAMFRVKLRGKDQVAWIGSHRTASESG